MTIYDDKNRKTYNVMDIAEYCLYYCSQINKEPISNLQLQKILYYIQAKFLVEKNAPCFDEDILAWEYGPVVEKVYSAFKICSGDKIIIKKEKININIEDEDKRLIQEICDIKSKYDAFDLVRMTHEEEPWEKTNRNNIIKLNIIKDYFNVNRERFLI